MLPPSLRCSVPSGMLIDFPLDSTPNVKLIFSGMAWATRVGVRDDAENPSYHQLLRYPARFVSALYSNMTYRELFQSEFTKK